VPNTTFKMPEIKMELQNSNSSVCFSRVSKMVCNFQVFPIKCLSKQNKFSMPYKTGIKYLITTSSGTELLTLPIRH
jgi:hypothetical protein